MPPLLLLVAEAAVLLVTSSAAYFWALWLERGAQAGRPESPFRNALSRKLQQLRLHHLSAERACPALSEASVANLDWPFLLNLRESGRAAAETWLAHGRHEPIMQQGILRAAE